MKKLFKSALLALTVAAAASSQAATYNNDLIIGFTSSTGNDLVYDLGSVGSLANGEQWNLSSLLSGFDLTTVNWGVVGTSATSGAARTSYTTRNGTPLDVNGLSAANGVNTAVGAIYSSFATAGAGQSATPSSSTDNSWNRQTLNPTLSSQYRNQAGNPNAIGLTSIQLWSDVGTAGNPPSSAGLLTFTLDSQGIVTYGSAVAVPEPSTYGMVAGAGLLLLSLRRKFAVQA